MNSPLSFFLSTTGLANVWDGTVARFELLRIHNFFFMKEATLSHLCLADKWKIPGWWLHFYLFLPASSSDLEMYIQGPCARYLLIIIASRLSGRLQVSHANKTTAKCRQAWHVKRKSESNGSRHNERKPLVLSHTRNCHEQGLPSNLFLFLPHTNTHTQLIRRQTTQVCSQLHLCKQIAYCTISFSVASRSTRSKKTLQPCFA